MKTHRRISREQQDAAGASRLSRRRFTALAGAAALAPFVVSRPAFAAWKPTKNVRLVVPFAPGGANDIIARLIGERLSGMWGQQVIVENKPGAGANIGAADVARSDPDGHHLLITSSAIVVNKFLFANMPFDAIADFAPVTQAAAIPNLMVVPAAAKSKTVAEFIAAAKASPGSMTYGSAGIGSSLHLIGEMFKSMAGVDIRHVPYRGAAPAMNDLVGGRIDVMFDTATVSMAQVRGGQIRALGVSTKGRLPQLPEVPPIADAVSGFDVGSWFALYYPVKTPRDIVESVSQDIRSALRNDAVKSKLDDLGAAVVASTPAELAAYMTAETERWGAVIRAAGIKPGDG